MSLSSLARVAAENRKSAAILASEFDEKREREFLLLVMKLLGRRKEAEERREDGLLEGPTTPQYINNLKHPERRFLRHKRESRDH